VPGTHFVAVDLARQSATVTFDPDRVRLADLRIALGRTGSVPRAETVVPGRADSRAH
jgi:copper chaperone CopZ